MEISPSLVGLLGFLAIFVLAFLNMPIAFVFGLVGFLGLAYLSGFEAATGTLVSEAWTQSVSYILMAVPLFNLMGELAERSGIGGDLYDAASKWLGRLPGGVSVATIWGCAGFGACTGTSLSAIMAFGPIAYKSSRDLGYDKRLIFGTICCGATMGVLIPPSVSFILYASITGESVGRLFMAGVLPGILQAVVYTAAVTLIAGFGIWKGPPGLSSTWKEKLISLKGVWGMLVLFFLVMGGIYGGILTPTEASAIAAFGSLVMFVGKRGFRFGVIRNALMECLRLSAMIYVLMIGSMVFSSFIAVTGLNIVLLDAIVRWNLPPMAFVWTTFLVFLILGCVLPATPMIVLLVPLLYPIYTTVYGFDGIWLGVLLVVMMELAFITPPVGINLFVTKSLFGEEASWGDIWKGVAPFIIGDTIRLGIIVYIPLISLWLPQVMR